MPVLFPNRTWVAVRILAARNGSRRTLPAIPSAGESRPSGKHTKASRPATTAARSIRPSHGNILRSRSEGPEPHVLPPAFVYERLHTARPKSAHSAPARWHLFA